MSCIAADGGLACYACMMLIGRHVTALLDALGQDSPKFE